MDAQEQLAALRELAHGLGIEVRCVAIGNSDDNGGACIRLKGKEILFLNSASNVAEQVSVLAGALAGRAQLDDRFLPPDIRMLLEKL